ncbi:MAG: hypothetical protein ACRDNG_11110, partial [Gaiellaceae bacterium]
YYGEEYFAAARADTLTSPEQLARELERLAGVGVTDIVLYPASADLDQVQLLAEAVRPSRRRPTAPDSPTTHRPDAAPGEEVSPPSRAIIARVCVAEAEAA